MAPIPEMGLSARDVDPPSGHTAPVATIIPPCHGWNCLSDSEQFGIIFSVIIVALILLGVLGCIFKRKKKDPLDELGLEMVQIPPQQSTATTYYTLPYGVNQPPQLAPPPSPAVNFLPQTQVAYPQPMVLPSPMIPTHQPVAPGPVYYQYISDGRAVHGVSATAMHQSMPPTMQQARQMPAGRSAYPPPHMYHPASAPPPEEAGSNQFRVPMPNSAYGYPQSQAKPARSQSLKQKIQRLFSMRPGTVSTLSDTDSVATAMTPSPVSSPRGGRAGTMSSKAKDKGKSSKHGSPPNKPSASTGRKASAGSTRPATPYPADIPPPPPVPPKDDHHGRNKSPPNDSGKKADTNLASNVAVASSSLVASDSGDRGSNSSLLSSSNQHDVRNGNKKEEKEAPRAASKASSRSWRSQARKSMEHNSQPRRSSSSSSIEEIPRAPEPIGGDWKSQTPYGLSSDLGNRMTTGCATDGTCTQISY